MSDKFKKKYQMNYSLEKDKPLADSTPKPTKRRKKLKPVIVQWKHNSAFFGTCEWATWNSYRDIETAEAAIRHLNRKEEDMTKRFSNWEPNQFRIKPSEKKD